MPRSFRYQPISICMERGFKYRPTCIEFEIHDAIQTLSYQSKISDTANIICPILPIPMPSTISLYLFDILSLSIHVNKLGYLCILGDLDMDTFMVSQFNTWKRERQVLPHFFPPSSWTLHKLYIRKNSNSKRMLMFVHLDKVHRIILILDS